jgi:hypothetical protein
MAAVAIASSSQLHKIPAARPALTPFSEHWKMASGAAGDKYRGAVVEDLQLPPAFALPFDEAISRAIELAYERDFSHIPYVICHDESDSKSNAKSQCVGRKQETARIH